jgi:hypothetical protein
LAESSSKRGRRYNDAAGRLGGFGATVGGEEIEN